LQNSLPLAISIKTLTSVPLLVPLKNHLLRRLGTAH
jgi:hypothetical protein